MVLMWSKDLSDSFLIPGQYSPAQKQRFVVTYIKGFQSRCWSYPDHFAILIFRIGFLLFCALLH